MPEEGGGAFAFVKLASLAVLKPRNKGFRAGLMGSGRDPAWDFPGGSDACGRRALLGVARPLAVEYGDSYPCSSLIQFSSSVGASSVARLSTRSLGA